MRLSSVMYLMTKRTRFWTLAALSLTVGMAAPAAAEEPRQGLNAPMILQMLSRPVEKPEAVMRERLRPDPPTVRPSAPRARYCPMDRSAMVPRPRE